MFNPGFIFAALMLLFMALLAVVMLWIALNEKKDSKPKPPAN